MTIIFISSSIKINNSYVLFRHDNYNDKPDSNRKSKKQHIRSSSCDIRIIRSNSQEYEYEPKTKKHFQNNFRNNSKDIEQQQDFRQKLTNTRNISKDDHTLNIKYILNNTGLMSSQRNNNAGDTIIINRNKKHSRNHSYDQIYMPNNIKIDQELHNKFNKNLSRKNSRCYDINMLMKNSNTKEFIENKFLFRKSSKDVVDNMAGPTSSTSSILESSKYHQHSRNNSRDLALNKVLDIVDDTANNTNNNSVLRHRRTSSKDLNKIGIGTTSSSSLSSDCLGKTTARKLSHHRIDIDQDDDQESALLRQCIHDDDHFNLNNSDLSSLPK